LSYSPPTVQSLTPLNTRVIQQHEYEMLVNNVEEIKQTAIWSLAKQRAVFKCKSAISMFAVSLGCTEALVRWGWAI